MNTMSMDIELYTAVSVNNHDKLWFETVNLRSKIFATGQTMLTVRLNFNLI